jgi:shikimate dehydrogenase
MTDKPTLRLGLIGGNIAASQAPFLHRQAGAQNLVRVTYDLLVPATLNRTMEQIVADCASSGYAGLNITYPYKEQVIPLLEISDPMVRRIGAANTVIFGADTSATGAPQGHNTDYTGFIAAYRKIRQDTPPGTVLMIGTGGVGRAVAFGLAALGADELRLVDLDLAKADALADDLRAAAPHLQITTSNDPRAPAKGAQGLINCTPIGMTGYPGTPLARDAMAGAAWAFDAVYTPVKTQFLADAASNGLAILSGWELFFYQGVHAWALFSNLPLNETKLRSALLKTP